MFLVINREKVFSYIFVFGIIVFLFCMGTFIKNEKLETVRVDSRNTNMINESIDK